MASPFHIANPLRGEVQFQAADRTWTFRLGMNELCSLQTAWGIPLEKGEQFWGRLQALSAPQALMQIFQFGLTRAHPDVKPEDLGPIFEELGIDRAAEIIGQALKWTMPDREEKDGADPKGKRRGIGARS